MPTLLIVGGQVLQSDGEVLRADVLLEQTTGEILEISPGLADVGDKTLDATGSLVTPGFVNGHCHIAMTLFRGYADDKPLDSWLREDIWPAEAVMTDTDVRIGTELGLVEMIKSGTTAFADMYFGIPETAAAVDKAGLRARLGRGIVTEGADERTVHKNAQTSLKMAYEYDGAADGRISTAFMPHSLTTVSESFLDEFVPKARSLDVPLHYHANETENEVTPILKDEGVRPLAYAAEKGLLEAEDFIAHGVHLDDTEIELLAETGTSVIHCPASNMKLASGMAPVQQLRDAGVTVGLGTDGAASNNDLSMLDEGRDAAMIGKLAAEDASAVPADAIVDMMTRESAAAIGIETGRLEVGAPADLAVIDLEQPHLTPQHDLVSHLVYAATAADVRHTICDGQVLMRDREVLTLDEEAVRERALKAGSALSSRVLETANM